MATYQQHYCSNCKGEDGYAYVFNVVINPDKNSNAYLGYSEPLYHKGTDGYWSIHCPQCDNRATAMKKRINGNVGKTACEAICEKATSSVCKCQCGGVNHGIRS